MAEFLIQREPVIKSTRLVLQVNKPTREHESPYIELCLTCPVNFARIIRGCTGLVFSNDRVMAIMPTNLEPDCGIINNPDNRVIVSE